MPSRKRERPTLFLFSLLGMKLLQLVCEIIVALFPHSILDIFLDYFFLSALDEAVYITRAATDLLKPILGVESLKLCAFTKIFVNFIFQPLVQLEILWIIVEGINKSVWITETPKCLCLAVFLGHFQPEVVL